MGEVVAEVPVEHLGNLRVRRPRYGCRWPCRAGWPPRTRERNTTRPASGRPRRRERTPPRRRGPGPSRSPGPRPPCPATAAPPPSATGPRRYLPCLREITVVGLADGHLQGHIHVEVAEQEGRVHHLRIHPALVHVPHPRYWVGDIPDRGRDVGAGVLPIRSSHRHQRATLAEPLRHRRAVDEPDLIVFSVDAVFRGRRQHWPPLIQLGIEKLPHPWMLDDVRVRIDDACHGFLLWRVCSCMTGVGWEVNAGGPCPTLAGSPRGLRNEHKISLSLVGGWCSGPNPSFPRNRPCQNPNFGARKASPSFPPPSVIPAKAGIQGSWRGPYAAFPRSTPPGFPLSRE